MRKVFLLLITAISFFYSDIQAQVTTVPTTLSTPRGNIRSERYAYNQQSPYMLRLSKKKKFSPKEEYEIRILLANDSVIVKAGKLQTKDGKQTITSDSLVITPKETKEIVFPVQEGEFLKGIPKDTCWLFKTTSGTINAYTSTPEPDGKEIVAIQKLSGEIMPFSKELLIEWLKLDAQAMKLAEKGKYIEAIKLYNQ